MKYLLFNDINYLIRKRGKLLLLLFFVPFIFVLLNMNNQLSTEKIIIKTMGINFDVKSFSLTELIMFMFSITISLFIIIDVYIKDIEYQLENIFLRMNSLKWYLRKSICFSIFMFILKISQYLLVILFMLLYGKEVVFFDIISICLNEWIYLLFIQYIFLLLYILSMFFVKNRLIAILLFLVIFLFLPKNIISVSNYNEHIFLVIIMIHIIISYIFERWNKQLIERV